MKKISNDQSKIDLVARLVKEGSIDFNEAIKLLEVETEKEFITMPFLVDHPTIFPQYPVWTGHPTFINGTGTISQSN